MAEYPINFKLNGQEFYKTINGIRQFEAKNVLLLAYKDNFYAGFQEAEAIAWVNFGKTENKKFTPISIKCNDFLSICRYQEELSFQGDTKLDAKASVGRFSVKNIPLNVWQPTIEYIEFVPKKLPFEYKKFLERINAAFKYATELHGDVKNIQLNIERDTLYITSIVTTGALAYIGEWHLNSKWLKFFKEIGLQDWLIPVAAVKLHLSKENSTLYVKDNKVIVYGENYHVIFSVQGSKRPIQSVLALLDKELLSRIELNFTDFYNVVSKIPNGKTIELRLDKANKELLIEADGFGQMQVGAILLKSGGENSSIVLNNKEFKQLVATTKLNVGHIEWNQFIKITCPTEKLTHKWLLSSSYKGEE
jgi:hypothetical protein